MGPAGAPRRLPCARGRVESTGRVPTCRGGRLGGAHHVQFCAGAGDAFVILGLTLLGWNDVPSRSARPSGSIRRFSVGSSGLSGHCAAINGLATRSLRQGGGRLSRTSPVASRDTSSDEIVFRTPATRTSTW